MAMNRVRGWIKQLRAAVRPGAAEREMRDELAFHLEQETERNIQRGMAPAAARRAARLSFGPVEAVKEELRTSGLRGMTAEILLDLRVTIRRLRSNPAFAAAAILSLGLGIGATTTVFSLGNGLLNKDIHASQPDRLARVYRNEHSPLPYSDLKYLQAGAVTFSGLAGEEPLDVRLTLRDGTERIAAAVVTGNFFSTLGVGAAAGRVFSYAAGQEQSASAVAVLAYDFWRTRFGADPTVIGRTLRINDQHFTVLGVAEKGFTSSQVMWQPRIFLPIGQIGSLVGTDLERWEGTLYVTGRLADGADLRQADAEVKLLWRQLKPADPRRDERLTARVDHARGMPAEARSPLAIAVGLLMASAILVLLIACANVANLLLARATAGRREIAARLALGASRARLVRQLLTESLTLALIGSGLGYAIAALTTPLFPRLLPADFPSGIDATPDAKVLLFAFGLAFSTALLFGLVPAIQASSLVLVSALRNDEAGRGFKRSRLRDALVIVQVTLCAVGIATAGLFVRSLQNARAADPGFDSSGIIDVPIYLEAARHDVRGGARFYRDVVESLEARPEIGSVTMARFVPLGGTSSGSALIRRGIDEAEPRRAPSAYKNEVAPGYFEMLDIRIVRGRGFTQRDGPDGPGVVILNQTAADRLWPGEDPIGQRVSIDEREGPFLEVVGIAEDTKYNSLAEEPQSFAYLPLLQRYRARVFLHIRATGSVGEAATAVREVLADTDSRVAIGAVRTMEENMSVSLLPARAAALLFGIFGLLALVIASIGLYGVTSYVVSRRTREIGIRIALGARPAGVLRLFMGGTLVRVGIGLVIGLGAAIAVGRLLSGVLYGVSPLDPAGTVVAPTTLVIVALFATYIAARRAATVDPVVALRHE